MSINIHVDLSGAIRQLGEMKKQIPFAASLAINRTAQSVKRRLVDEMVNVFDRPTPYTLDSVYIKPSMKHNLVAEIGLKDDSFKGIPASKFLFPQIEGGSRSQKRFERALIANGIMPRGFVAIAGGGVDLDRYGNIPRRLIIELLAYFRAFPEMGYKANMTAKRRANLFSGSLKKRGYRYFMIGLNHSHLAPGIYKTWRGSRELLCMVQFVSQANYQKRFRFLGVSQQAIDETWHDNFQAAINKAIRTAR